MMGTLPATSSPAWGLGLEFFQPIPLLGAAPLPGVQPGSLPFPVRSHGATGPNGRPAAPAS